MFELKSFIYLLNFKLVTQILSHIVYVTFCQESLRIPLKQV